MPLPSHPPPPTPHTKPSAVVLRHVTCLDKLTSRHYCLLARKIKHTITRHKIGEKLYVKGDVSTGVYIILRGGVKVMCSKSDLPNKRILKYLKTGDCIGDLELLVNRFQQDENQKIIPRTTNVTFTAATTTIFIPKIEFFWICHQQSLYYMGKLREGENDNDIVCPDHWHSKQTNLNTTTCIDEDDYLTKIRMKNAILFTRNHMSHIINTLRSTRKDLSICDVLDNLAIENIEVGKVFGSNLSLIYSLLPNLDASRMCLLSTASFTSHLPPKSILDLNGKKTNQKKRTVLDKVVKWIAKGQASVTFLDGATGKIISKSLSRSGRCFGLSKELIESISGNTRSTTRHHHHSNRSSGNSGNNGTGDGSTPTQIHKKETTLSNSSQKPSKIRCVIETLTTADVVTLKSNHLLLLGGACLFKLLTNVEMFTKNVSRERLLKQRPTDRLDQSSNQHYQRTQELFGLLQPTLTNSGKNTPSSASVAVATVVSPPGSPGSPGSPMFSSPPSTVAPSTMLLSPATCTDYDATNEAAQSMLQQQLQQLQQLQLPPPTLTTPTALLTADQQAQQQKLQMASMENSLNSMYHHPDPMGDPFDPNYSFANFTAPPSSPPRMNSVQRRQRKNKPITPGRKVVVALDYDGQMFVRASITQPSPGISIASMSSVNHNVQKLQPVSMEQPLPTARYGFTKTLVRRTTSVHPFQEKRNENGGGGGGGGDRRRGGGRRRW